MLKQLCERLSIKRDFFKRTIGHEHPIGEHTVEVRIGLSKVIATMQGKYRSRGAFGADFFVELLYGLPGSPKEKLISRAIVAQVGTDSLRYAEHCMSIGNCFKVKT